MNPNHSTDRRTFIVNARRASTSGDFSLDNLARHGQMQIVAHCMQSALFLSGDLREHVTLYLVLGGPPSPPRTIRIESDEVGGLGGFDERSLATVVKDALAAGGRLTANELQCAEGVYVSKRAVEHLIPADARPFYRLDRKGIDVRGVELADNPTFLLTDNLALPRKTAHYLDRSGIRKLRLGPRKLFASHCIVLVHNELDRRQRDAPP